jgi:hypothetical protein
MLSAAALWFSTRDSRATLGGASKTHNENQPRDFGLASTLVDHRHAATVLPASAYTARISIRTELTSPEIDRRKLLESLFSLVTSGSSTVQEKVEAWVRYIQDRFVHPKFAPTHDNGQAIYDPYWLLVNRVAHCGQANRLIVDGLRSAGIDARLVQLKAHVAAEAWINDAWRFLDADWLNLGQFVRYQDGSLPSALEIHQNPSLLVGVRPGLEFKMYPVEVLAPNSEPYQQMFRVRPFYYVKTATVEQERNVYFGWNYYKLVRE